MIRLVISDVDGTIVDESEKMPEQIGELSSLIKECGILFTIASGREYSQIQELQKKIGITIPVIMCNGSVAGLEKKLVWCESLDSEVAKEITEFADACGMTVIVSLPEQEYAYRRTHFVEQTIANYNRFDQLLDISSGWKSLPVQKLLIIDKERTSDENYGKVIQLLEKYKGRISYTDYGQSLDIVSPGCSKADGMKRLAKELNIELSEIMAVGDSFNDIEMIQLAGKGIAVNNAVVKLKKEADYVCQGKYIEGVMEAIRHFCKEEEKNVC